MAKSKQNKTIPAVQTPIVCSIVTDPQGDQNSAAPKVTDERKRLFLRLAGLGGLTVLLASILPKKAQALIMGSTPGTSVMGIKNASNVTINPATEETLGILLNGQGVIKLTAVLSASGVIRTPTAGKKLRVYCTRFSLNTDATDVSFRFTSGGTDYEKYLNPKAGGLYGANNHPNYVEGGINQALYCNITPVTSTTVQINIDFLEV